MSDFDPLLQFFNFPIKRISLLFSIQAMNYLIHFGWALTSFNSSPVNLKYDSVWDPLSLYFVVIFSYFFHTKKKKKLYFTGRIYCQIQPTLIYSPFFMLQSLDNNPNLFFFKKDGGQVFKFYTSVITTNDFFIRS